MGFNHLENHTDNLYCTSAFCHANLKHDGSPALLHTCLSLSYKKTKTCFHFPLETSKLTAVLKVLWLISKALTNLTQSRRQNREHNDPCLFCSVHAWAKLLQLSKSCKLTLQEILGKSKIKSWSSILDRSSQRWKWFITMQKWEWSQKTHKTQWLQAANLKYVLSDEVLKVPPSSCDEVSRTKIECLWPGKNAFLKNSREYVKVLQLRALSPCISEHHLKSGEASACTPWVFLRGMCFPRKAHVASCLPSPFSCTPWWKGTGGKPEGSHLKSISHWNVLH